MVKENFDGCAERRLFLSHGARWLGLASAGWSLIPVQAAPKVSSAPIRVLAASDLKYALTRVANEYQTATGQTITLTFGSSGNMARQIQQGLGADLFMSADEELALQLARQGMTRGGDAGVLYALGRLALYRAPHNVLPLDPRLEGVRQNWDMVNKFAIANPEHAPYGRAARDVLQGLGMWSLVQPRLVLGDNIAQATQFVSTGAAQAGITALSLVMAPELQGQGDYVPLPPNLHAPLRQRMVILDKAREPTSAFFNYLQQAPTRVVLARYGFIPPP